MAFSDFNFNRVTTQGVGTTLTAVYTCPGTKQAAVVLGVTLSNKILTPINVDVKHKSGATETFIVNDAPIPIGSTLVPVDNKNVVLLPNDQIIVSSTNAASVDAIVSVVEFTA